MGDAARHPAVHASELRVPIAMAMGALITLPTMLARITAQPNMAAKIEAQNAGE